MRLHRPSPLPLWCFLLLSAAALADPPPAPAIATNQASAAPSTPATNLPAATVPDSDPVKQIIAAHTCTQVEPSPDKLWVAVTRDYARPPRSSIWENGDSQSCLEIRQLNEQGDGFDPSFVYWEDPSLDILEIAWSPDSRFLVLLCAGSSGHQPWAHPTFVLDIQDDKVHGLDPFGTVVSDHLKFSDKGELELSTGEPSSPQPVQIDLAKHIGDLPVVLQLREQRP
jgi:hypothetical protein